MQARLETKAATLPPGDDVPPLVRGLLRPEARGAPDGDEAILKTTHASWVLVGAREVWKLKRPVDFGFLDFRTVEARRRACEDEVRLNRPLAPGVYLSVEPVRQTARGYAVGGDGPIVDWAVRMRRLPDRCSGEALLARGALGPERLERLAERLAAFFATARPAPTFGGVEVMRANVEENFTQAESMVGTFLDAATRDDIRRFQTEALSANEARFAARVAGGHIREGHGDLRLEHVYFIGPSTIAVIDCIEFNERFRCGDVAGEVAFLAMELIAADRPDLAEGFVARFAEARQDFDLYGVLDFYLSYRAFVRGKVAAFVARDPQAPREVRSAKAEEARSRFALSRAAAGRPLASPFVVAVGGLIGSGKSTLAAALGRSLAVPVISTDRTRKSMAGLAATERAGGALYQPEQLEATYREVLRRAGEVVGAGRGVVLDATFAERAWRQAAAELARKSEAGFAFIEVSCPDEARVRERLAARRTVPSVSDATEVQLDTFRQRYQHRDASDPQPWLTVDTSGSTETAVVTALRGLAALGLPATLSRPA